MTTSLPIFGRRTATDRMRVEPPPQFPAAMVNITNRCNLTCSHCFVFTDGNPNDPAGDMSDDEALAALERVRDRHGVWAMLWMGGEPMLRWRLLQKAIPLFRRNIITTNGTVPLKDFGAGVTYVVSLDGPEELNDPVRGDGVYAKVRKSLLALPDGFAPTVQIQCVVTKQNQHRLEELVVDFLDTPVNGMAFSFMTPSEGEHSELSWADVAEREAAVDIVLDLKRRYRGFIWNSSRALELMRPATAKLVTDNCPALRTVLPLYVENGEFTNPKCCYGNNADCDRCGGWVVFAHANKLPGPWDDIVPRTAPIDTSLATGSK